jgi:hypothetical protein
VIAFVWIGATLATYLIAGDVVPRLIALSGGVLVVIVAWRVIETKTRQRTADSLKPPVPASVDDQHDSFAFMHELHEISEAQWESELARRQKIRRLVVEYEPMLGQPVCLYCRRTGNEAFAKIPFIGELAEMAQWWKCRNKTCGLWVCQRCTADALQESPSDANCPRCGGKGFWQRWAAID